MLKIKCLVCLYLTSDLFILDMITCWQESTIGQSKIDLPLTVLRTISWSSEKMESFIMNWKQGKIRNV